MRQIISILVLILLFSAVAVVAVIGENDGQGNGVQDQEQNQEQNQDDSDANNVSGTEEGNESDGLRIGAGESVRARTVNELKHMIQEREQELRQNLTALEKREQKVYENQNRVRLAVHSLLAMEDLVGGIGKNVSVIARDFNNSVMATIRAEERIQTRSRIVRFLAGGDNIAAEEIEGELTRNEARLQLLKDLMETCGCDEEVRTIMEENIQNMEQEMERLRELSREEKKVKGLFGWLWK